MRVAYFINQYPAATHTFIRREIRAMEALGVSIYRYALRPGENKSVDPEDEIEETRTRYILRAGLWQFIRCCTLALLTQPASFAGAVWQALQMGWRSDRGVLRHLVYVAEATVLASWCRLESIQHVHAHFGTNSTSVAMLAKYFSGVTYSFTLHGPDEFDKAEALSLSTKLERCAFAVCISSFGRSQLMRWSSPEHWRKIAIVHCGVDPLFLDHPVFPSPAMPRLVCVGRLDAKKGQIVLVEAVRRLADAGIDCEIILVGDGPYRKPIEQAIRRGGLEKTIRLIGWASGQKVKDEMIAARAFVLPSFAEGLPVVIMEAMALGRPVVSTYIAGIPELVESGKTGWLVPAGDDMALAEALCAALKASPDQLDSMGAAGLRRVADAHDSLKEAAKLKKLFENKEQLHSLG